MSKRLLAVVPLALTVVVACGSSSGNLACPTTTQSISFSALGSCSGATAGKITISTQPGLCSLLVENGEELGLPAQGQFTGDADKTGYDITKGNWTLNINEGNAADGSTNVICSSTVDPDGMIDLECNSTVCAASDCTGGSCNDSSCTEHLTPD